jgi:RNA polymerase sigma-70 factor (ECF subfamily)
MLAHVHSPTFAALRPAFRRMGVLLRLPMTASPEALEMNALLGRVAVERDRAAFATLFAHFAPRVKAYLLRQGAGPAVAEDLAQEALLSLWRKAHLFDPAKASAGTWLFTIARNLRIDAIRREKRPELDPEDFMSEPEPAADEGMARCEDEARLRVALKELPADQAQVVELSFFADKPHSQIASELDIPLGTVKSRLRLAMARLRTALGEMS